MNVFNIFPRIPESFSVSYRCYSVSCFPGKEDLENGGKIIMPPSALDQLTRLHIQYPMLFKLSNDQVNKVTHCGVLEFVADEGRVYLPYWMMKILLVDQGEIITVQNVSLEVARFAKFKPQSIDFLDITNPKAVLENALRDFACLTVGDIIAIRYNKKIYELLVLESKPKNAVSIIECDMQVEFDAPDGYEESLRQQKQSYRNTAEEEDEIIIPPEITNKFKVFGGEGRRLDGKAKHAEQSMKANNSETRQRGVPNYDYKPGNLTFFRNPRKSTADKEITRKRKNSSLYRCREKVKDS